MRVKLTDPPARASECYFPGEEKYFEAHEWHMEAAHCLEVGRLIGQAYQALMFGIECYLKDLYCRIRSRVLGVEPDKAEGARVPRLLWPLLKVEQGQLSKAALKSLNATSLKHDVQGLLQVVGDAVTGLASVASLQSQLESGEAWVERRYDPTAADSEGTARYETLKSAFAAFRAEIERRSEK